jgi:acyl-CoA dehydrogenase
MRFAEIGCTEEQIQMLDIAGDFCRDRAGMDRTRAMMDSEGGFDPNVWREMADLGWLGISIPENHGGVGLSLAEVVPVVEQMGRRLVPSPLVSTTLAAQLLLAGGSEAHRSEWLPVTSQHWRWLRRMAIGIWSISRRWRRIRPKV